MAQVTDIVGTWVRNHTCNSWNLSVVADPKTSALHFQQAEAENGSPRKSFLPKHVSNTGTVLIQTLVFKVSR